MPLQALPTLSRRTLPGGAGPHTMWGGSDRRMGHLGCPQPLTRFGTEPSGDRVGPIYFFFSFFGGRRSSPCLKAGVSAAKKLMNAEPMRPTHRPVEHYHESLIQFSSPILTSQP